MVRSFRENGNIYGFICCFICIYLTPYLCAFLISFSDSLRKRAWPKLLGVDCTDKSVVPPNLYNFRP